MKKKKQTKETPPAPQSEIIIPEDLDYSQITRNVLVGEPRITRFKIAWDEDEVMSN